MTSDMCPIIINDLWLAREARAMRWEFFRANGLMFPVQMPLSTTSSSGGTKYYLAAGAKDSELTQDVVHRVNREAVLAPTNTGSDMRSAISQLVPRSIDYWSRHTPDLRDTT